MIIILSIIIHQQSTMKNKYRFLKILVTLIVFGFLLHFSLKRFGEKKITHKMIDIRLNNENTEPVYFISEADIREIIDKENPMRKIGKLNVPALERSIRSLSMVDSANVYLNLNGNLSIEVMQRVPIFRLMKKDKNFYVDAKGIEFPISRNYSHRCMLVSGNVKKEEYPQVIELIKRVEADDFTKKYFVGIQKSHGDYYLITSDGNFRVELGDLENIDFKIKGFKTFVEKHLVYQDIHKYTKISLKYNNQIVTTLNPNFIETEKEKLATR